MTLPCPSLYSAVEPLESRIAPALAVLNPLPDLTAGSGFSGTDIDLSRMFDPFITDNGRTIVSLQTNFDADPNTPGIQASAPIVLELYDDLAPLTVQNFLSYLNNSDSSADYVGTFFHRAVAGFVLQGGGYNASKPSEHIEVGLNVHNEYDPSRSNLEGTIAMAKLGVDPNTATSEWFINLGDNSGNLDNQNGGFTVFGRVLSGMEVAKAIVQLPTYTGSGQSTAPPVQNYNADPDLNPNTPAPVATPDNLITVTSKTVTRPPNGTANNSIVYSFDPAVDVVDATTGLPSTLLTGTVTGSNLHLIPRSSAAGVVRVTVHGSDGSGSSASDTFVVDLKSNLVASFADDPFDGIIIGGDQKEAKIVLGNTGGGWASGLVNIKVYLSEARRTGSDGAGGFVGPDPYGLLVQPDVDLLIGDFHNQPVDLASGGEVTLTKTLSIPKMLVTKAGIYRVLIEVTPVDASMQERFSDDNVSLDSAFHNWDNLFGSVTVPGFGKRQSATLVYQEPDGDTVELFVSNGAGHMEFDGTLTDMAVLKVSRNSVFSGKVTPSATAEPGHRPAIDLHNIESFAFTDRLDFSKVTLSGSLSLPFGVHELRLGDVTGGGSLAIGHFPAGEPGKASISLKSVSDFSLQSAIKIGTLRALEWRNTDGVPDLIKAPSIGNLIIAGYAGDATRSAVRGDLEANVRLGTSHSLATMSVAGFFSHAALVTRGDVDEVKVGGMDHANLFVGVSNLPHTAAAVAEAGVLGSFSVEGVGGGADAFIDSRVAARQIGSIFVKHVDRDGDSGKFGFVADAIKSYNRANTFIAGSRTAPQTFDRLGDYQVRIL